VRSHFGHLLLYSAIIAAFFSILTRRELKQQLKLGALIWLGMAGGVLLLAYVLFPFPR
jgi:hypothetical protein